MGGAVSDGTENRSVLRQYFPEIPSFRPGQEAAIDRTVAAKNTLCLMPTGGGKSLVYQTAGIRRGGTTLVLSPLVALMGEQAQRLGNRAGITASCLSDLSGPPLYNSLRDFDFEHGPNFMLTSPERLSASGYLEYALRRNRNAISLIVVDEAHCVSQWGHTFRPAYRAIPRSLDAIFGRDEWPPVLCLTATLNPRDRAEIVSEFRIAPEDVITTPSMLRENLVLRCEELADEPAKKVRLAEILAAHRGEKVLVYVHRKEGEYGTEQMSAHFAALGIECAYYDADLKDTEKDAALAGFHSGAVKVMFATNAFGMGIDISDIRVVVHYLLPESIEQYYQEVGRAGRDGRSARGLLLFSETNKKVRRDLIKRSVVKRSEIERMFETKLALREGETLRTIDPFCDIVEEKGERSAWYALQLAGVVQVLAKGPSNVQCFAPTSKGVAGDLERYLAAGSRAGLVKTVARKLALPVPRVIDDLWRFFHEGTAKLVSAPSQGNFFTTPAVPPVAVFDEIERDLGVKLTSRLDGFERLVEMIGSGGDPTDGIRSHLGIGRE